MALMVDQERARWLNLSSLSLREKTQLLDVPVDPNGMFGPAYNLMLKRWCSPSPAFLRQLTAFQIVSPNQPTGPAGPEPAAGAQRCMGARGDAPSSYSLWSHEETARYLGRGGQGEGMFKALQKACRSPFGLHDQRKKRKNFRVNGPLYDALSITENDQWRRIRSVLSPCFSSGRLKEMSILMKQHSANLVRSITKRVDNNEDVLELKE
ncbi:unnamed protein product [Arctogadus glacialis]